MDGFSEKSVEKKQYLVKINKPKAARTIMPKVRW